MHTLAWKHTKLLCQPLGRTHVILSGLLLFTLPIHRPSLPPEQACSVKSVRVSLANFNTITFDSYTHVHTHTHTHMQVKHAKQQATLWTHSDPVPTPELSSRLFFLLRENPASSHENIRWLTHTEMSNAGGLLVLQGFVLWSSPCLFYSPSFPFPLQPPTLAVFSVSLLNHWLRRPYD